MEFQVEATTYVPPVKENPLIETVRAHIEESAENPAAARTITVPVADAGKAQLLYQKAANELGKTAKLRIKDDSAVKKGKPDEDGNDTFSGNVKLTFTITTRNKARRGPKPAAEAEVSE